MDSASFPNIVIERKSDTSANLIVQASIERDQAGHVHSACKFMLEEGCHTLTIDMGGVGVIDSAGVGMLIGIRANTKAKGGNLTLKNVNPGVLKVFEINKVDVIFNIE